MDSSRQPAVICHGSHSLRGRNGYIAICTTPWNAGYQAEHPENGPYTHVGVRFEPSLGRMDYKRVVRYTLIEDGDYNDACKIYRDYVKNRVTYVRWMKKLQELLL